MSSSVSFPGRAAARVVFAAEEAPGVAAPRVLPSAGAVRRDGAAPVPRADFPPSCRRDPREPPVFAALRSSKGRPVPQEARTLAEEITAGATNATQRARAIYDWITSHIRYDAEEWANITGGADGYAHAHDPAAVLARGTTVCVGYAWLFDALCEAAGVESDYVIGDVRGYRGTPDEDLVTAFKHAWNVVRLDDGSWRLLDATWGAAQEGEDPAAAKARADYYFATPAWQFVHDHLPEDAGRQLLDDPVPTREAFAALPNLKPPFFRNGLRPAGECTSVMSADSSRPAALSFAAPAGVAVAATLGPYEPGAAPRQIPVFARDGVVTLVVPGRAPGPQLLRLYAKAPGGDAFECAADFVIRDE